MTRPVVITGGGTGGHLFPMRAIADALETATPSVPVHFVGSRRGQDARLLADRSEPVLLLGGKGLRRSLHPSAVTANLGAVLGLMGALGRALVACATWRPRAVVSVGGYASFPFSLAAVVLRRPLVLVELDAHASASQRILTRFAAARCVAWPTAGAVHLTGVPVREELLALSQNRLRAEMDPPLDPHRLVIVVMTGSLGATSVNDAVVDLAGRWADRADVTLVHITGRRDFEQVVARRPVTTGLDYRVVPFGDMTSWWSVADVAVCRAGATTLAEITLLGIPAVVVPLPGAPGDHQTRNASALASAHAAVIVPDRDCSATALATALTPFFDVATRQRMADASRTLGHPDAAKAIASVVNQVAR